MQAFLENYPADEDQGGQNALAGEPGESSLGTSTQHNMHLLILAWWFMQEAAMEKPETQFYLRCAWVDSSDTLRCALAQ